MLGGLPLTGTLFGGGGVDLGGLPDFGGAGGAEVGGGGGEVLEALVLVDGGVMKGG